VAILLRPITTSHGKVSTICACRLAKSTAMLVTGSTILTLKETASFVTKHLANAEQTRLPLSVKIILKINLLLHKILKKNL
jgi:hypothetical protein